MQNKLTENQKGGYIASISKENGSFLSPTFRIRYSAEEVPLNVLAQFRTAVDPVTIYDKSDFFIEVTLFWAKQLTSQNVLAPHL